MTLEFANKAKRLSACRAHRLSGLLFSTSMSLLLVASPSLAQQSDTPVQEEVFEVDEIVVTGSRIARSGQHMPTPTTALNRQSIELSGVTNIADAVRELPALGLGVSPNVDASFTGQPGLNILNLRSLGTDRTLVLVNGRRHVGAVSGGSQVDLNTIPTALVDRVEVITGGASAIYGADAVTGVVNFIMKKDFEGLQVDAQYGIHQEGDGENYNLNLLTGANFADDRGNAVLSVSYDKAGRIRGIDRDRINRTGAFVPNPLDTGEGDGIPAQIFQEDIRLWIFSPTGVFLDLGAPSSFDAAGNLIPHDIGNVVSGVISEGGDGLNLAESVELQAPLERILLSGNVNYKLTEDIEFFFEGTYANVKGESTAQALTDAPVFIATDNPFLPADLTATLQGFGLPGIGLFRYHDDIAITHNSRDNDTFRLAGGFNGQINEDLSFEAYYQYGRSTSFNVSGNQRHLARFAQAVDAIADPLTGNAVCRDPEAVAAGCVPLNLIGSGRSPQAAIDYAIVDLTSRAVLQQHVAGASVSGDIAEVPAGSVGFAAGIEWRKEKSLGVPDSLALSGVTSGPTTAITAGDYSVKEAFAEVAVPLLSDVAFAQELNFEAAIRLSDYSTVGTATAWKLGGEWVPVEGVRFRGTYSRAVRAPNIGELFAPASGSEEFVEDPCDGNNLGLGPNPANRQANCAALGLLPDFESNAQFRSVPVTNRGNPDLNEEVAKTYTLGVVLAPEIIPGLLVSADLWDVNISGAIAGFDPTTILNNCVDLSSLGDTCSLVTRAGDGQIQNIDLLQFNLQSIEARGVDLEVNYGTRIGSDAGNLNFRVVGTYLNRLNQFFTEQPEDVVKTAGQFTAPKWRLNGSVTYSWQDLTVFWEGRYIGRTRHGAGSAEEFLPLRMQSAFYQDIQLSYRINENLSARLGVDNLFNADPPRTLDFQGGGFHDTNGRFFYGGISLKL